MTKFYKGGFEPSMNRREAALILQLKYGPFMIPEPKLWVDRHSERTLNKDKIRANHRRLMIINHPDRGGR